MLYTIVYTRPAARLKRTGNARSASGTKAKSKRSSGRGAQPQARRAATYV
jgi:hypothetical protein